MVCDPEKLLNIKNNILVLIHAKYCPKDPCECTQVKFQPSHWLLVLSCELYSDWLNKIQSHCIEFKEVQEHMKNCHDPEGTCDVKYCVQSRQYIRYHLIQLSCDPCYVMINSIVANYVIITFVRVNNVPVLSYYVIIDQW